MEISAQLGKCKHRNNSSKIKKKNIDILNHSWLELYFFDLLTVKGEALVFFENKLTKYA